MSETDELEKNFKAQQKQPQEPATTTEDDKPVAKKGKKMSGLMIAAIALVTASAASLLTVFVWLALVGGL